MPERFLCIHGHFYQPPREDPWMDMIFPEGSAAPSRHWNERISRECYAPLALSRRQNGEGRIFDIVNCYEWMSFNFGPTILTWLERADPATYARILDADRRSLERWGHGNAMAQIYHHVIMPLATDLEKRTETAWAVEDFRTRFGRDPEGMWLSEAAVDTDTLEILAEYGIRFVLLAPRQAASVAPLEGEDWRDVNEGSLDVRRPYRLDLPSGKRIAVYFYHGGISQAIAFEGLLRNGDHFWSRILDHAGEGLLSIGTDGETYGHHFKFGDMALAHVLSKGAEGADDLPLTNFGAYLESHPPTERVRLHEASSWSCVHGVERWRSDCGCSTGGHPGWNQRWREPLREGLRAVKDAMDEHFLARGGEIFPDPVQTLLNYGRVLAGRETPEDFAASHCRPETDEAGRDAGTKLLAMQQWALASFASCAWFFDDIGRIEPLNALTFALRAMGLAKRTGLRDLEPELLAIVDKAQSNDPAAGNGEDLWKRDVLPRRETLESLVAQAYLMLWSTGSLPEPGESRRKRWPGVEVLLTVGGDAKQEAEGEADDAGAGNGGYRSVPQEGTAMIRWRHETGGDEVAWRWEPAGQETPFSGKMWRSGPGEQEGECIPADCLPWEKRQEIADAWVAHCEERAWVELRDRAQCGPQLFLPFREGQDRQTLAYDWERLWSAMVWAWITGTGDGHEDLLHYLGRDRCEHSDCVRLSARFAKLLGDLLREDTPDWDRVNNMLERARSLGMVLDLWEAQNVYWIRAGEGVSNPRTAELLGFLV